MGNILSKIVQKCSVVLQKCSALFQKRRLISQIRRRISRIWSIILQECSLFFHKRPVQVVLACILLGLLATAVFYSRKPVILVTDEPFNLLYGERRTRRARLVLSLRLFRQVKTSAIARDAGPDLVAQAAASLSQRPYGVFFPYRYREGARRYLKEQPGLPVFILGGRNRPDKSGEGEPWWFCTDNASDLYRAGFLAGELALQALEGGAAGLYQDGLGEEERAAFSQGVSEQGWSEAPFISSQAETTSRFLREKSASIALYKKPDPRFYDEGSSIILFTWMEPDLVTGKTAAIFDDSPWAQIAPALKLLKKEKISPGMTGFSLVPSKCTVVKGSFGQKKGIMRINRIKSLKYKERNTDNKNSV